MKILLLLTFLHAVACAAVFYDLFSFPAVLWGGLILILAWARFEAKGVHGADRTCEVV